jgi:Flp pilus assembly protein TadG
MSRTVRARRHEAGTAALETMVVMSFLFTLIFGFVQICMFVMTRSMTNYAAFTASRAMMVGGNRDFAARQVMSEVQWWPGGIAANSLRVLVQQNQLGPRLPNNQRRRGVRVTYLLPFGYPIFRGLGPVRAVGFAPTSPDHSEIREEGDNK